LGFGLLPVNIKDSNPMSATVSQATYVFYTGGIVVPEAPYYGGVGGQAPTISDTSEAVTQTLAGGTVTGTRQLDVMLYTLRLGPSFYWDLNEYFGLSLGAGPALGLVSGNYQYNEIISASGVSARNTGQIGATDVTFGGYVNGTLMYHVINDADFYLSAQYMPLGSAAISGAGREGKLNLGGQVYVSFGINWPF
jgi:hypothetical protein